MTPCSILKSRHILIIFCSLAYHAIIGSAWAETLIINGILDGGMRVTQKSHFAVEKEIKELWYRFALPANLTSKTVSQSVSDLKIYFNPQPSNIKDEVDRFGNIFKTATWKNINKNVTVTIDYIAWVKSELPVLESRIHFPLSSFPRDVVDYLNPTKEVQSDHEEIIAVAKRLTKEAKTEYDAVSAVINYVADNIMYAHNPESFDALYTLRSKSGNCTNIAHIAIALLRAIGIPARIVGGVGLKKRWPIPIGNGENLIFGFSQGNHAWIEVYFPDIGWLPYDTQQTKNFTSTRHIKKTHGMDFHTVADSWWGTPYFPNHSDTIEENFFEDVVSVSLKTSEKMPKMCMISNELKATTENSVATEPHTIEEPPIEPQKKPQVAAEKPPEPGSFPPSPVEFPAVDKEPPPRTKEQPHPLERPQFPGGEAITFGNMQFPALIDFYRIIDNRAVAIFDMETAEYATSEYVYAQAFTNSGKMQIDSLSLAMRRFGGDGTIYIDLVADENGRPGLSGLRSSPVAIEKFNKMQGYYWVTFSFPFDKGIILEKGKYWIILRHSGEVIMNWFYTPGKKYGGVYDTRSTSKGYQWNDILNYDLVFKVEGKR